MDILIRRIDEVLIPFLRRWSVPALRFSVGVVFIWFGLLKVFGISPVEELVSATVYWIDPDWFIPALGVVEVFVGVGLVIGKAIRLVLLVLVVQMIGTFLVFVFVPTIAFREGNLFRLTTEGEFILKNLVLLAAAMVVGGSLEPGRGLEEEQVAQEA